MESHNLGKVRLSEWESVISFLAGGSSAGCEVVIIQEKYPCYVGSVKTELKFHTGRPALFKCVAAMQIFKMNLFITLPRVSTILHLWVQL